MSSRRELLAGGAAALAISGCDRLSAGASRWLGADWPDRVDLRSRPEASPERHLLDRAAFGPWPGDEERVRGMGIDAWIDEQLAPGEIDDAPCDLRTAFVDAMIVPSDLLFELRPEEVERQLVSWTLMRAVLSRRQLFEVMVETWSDHFHVAIGKSLCRHLEVSYVTDAIRPHALGRFRDLLRATALSPAMLVYLDGRENVRSVPNENYARELLELHALGVHGGYAQRDVMEAARCLTGWRVREEGAPGTVIFDRSLHDEGRKIVLGIEIPARGGEQDLERLLDAIVSHPSCALHASRALCRALVADDPPASVVGASAERFRTTGGDIAEILRTILRSEEFAASQGARIKRPFRYVVSSLRALGASPSGDGDTQEWLRAMGHAPFQHPTPDGAPREGEAYLATLLSRWRFALALARGELDDANVDLARVRRGLGGRGRDRARRAFRHLVGRDARSDEALAIDRYAAQAAARDVLALVLASPAYQRH